MYGTNFLVYKVHNLFYVLILTSLGLLRNLDILVVVALEKFT